MPCSLTGKFTNPDTTSDTPGYVRFDLYNTGGNYPQVNGAAIAPSQQFTLSATDGSWSGTIYRNDEISVNGSFSTYWHVRYFVSGQQVGPALDYYITTSTATIGGIGGLAPITQYPAPAPPAQPLVGAASSLASFPLAATTWTNVHNMGTQSVVVQCYDANFNQIIPDNVQNTSINQTVVTFLEPQAGFMVVMNVGNWTPSVTNPNYLISNPTSSQSIAGDYPFTFGGTLNVKRLGAIRIASQFAGADLGAKINAADADLGVNPGEIWVDQSAGTAIATVVSLSANHILRFVQGGTYTLSAAITCAGEGSAIIGQPAAMGIGVAPGQTPVVLQQANGANLAALITASGGYNVFQDFTLDGNAINNSTAGVGLMLSSARPNLFRLTVQNCKTHGCEVSGVVISKAIACMFIANGSDGVYQVNSPDSFFSMCEFENNMGCGMELNNSATARLEHCDFGGNHLDGLYVYGTSTGGGSNGQILVGNQWGNNYQNDIHIVGYDTVNNGYSAVAHTIVGNSFYGSNNRTPNNTYDCIQLKDVTHTSVTGNYISSTGSPNQAKYGIEILETASGRSLRNVVSSSQFNGSFGTAAFVDSAVNKSLFVGNDELGGGQSLLGPGVYHANNDPLYWKDNGGGIQSILNLGGDNNVYFNGHPTTKQVVFQPNPGTTRLVVSDGGLYINGGTSLQRYARYTPTLSPSSVAANTTAEQTFTNVLTSGDVVVGVSKPTAQAGLGIVGWRASGTSLCITFSNNTAGAITPTASEQYAVIAVQ